MEIRLKLKYRCRKPGGRKGRGNVSGNSGSSEGKHTPHPDVFAYKRNGYKCEPRWNPRIAN